MPQVYLDAVTMKAKAVTERQVRLADDLRELENAISLLRRSAEGSVSIIRTRRL